MNDGTEGNGEGRDEIGGCGKEQGEGAERCAGGNGPEVQDEAGRDRVERNGMQSGMERGRVRRSRTAGTETVRGLAGGSLLGGGSHMVFTAETTLQPECCSVVCGVRRVLRRGFFTEEPAIRRPSDRRIPGVRFCPAPR